MRWWLAVTAVVFALSGCGHSGRAAGRPFTVEHIRDVFAAQGLHFTVPRSFAVGYSCTRLRHLRAFLRGRAQWNGMVFGTEAAAIEQERCSRRAGLTRPYFNARRRNLVIIGKVSVRRRIQTALDAL